MFYITDSFYDYFSNTVVNNWPTILIGIGASYIGIVGTILVCSKSKPIEVVSDCQKCDFSQLDKSINFNKIRLMGISGDHEALSQTILEHSEDLERIKRDFEFRIDMKTAELTDLRNRLKQIEENIYETSEEI